MNPVVISLCDFTGNMVKPWAEAGYECWCVDLQHSIRKERIEGNIHFVWGDARSWFPPMEVRGRIHILFAAPPCTDVALSDARDFQLKRGWMLSDSLQLFDSCMMCGEYSGARYMIENPKSRFSTHRREPDFKFQPWEFGDNYFKETWLWTGGGFVFPKPLFLKRQDPEQPELLNEIPQCPPGTTSVIHEMTPSDDRANRRSETPAGFAKAVFDANRL